MEVLKHTHKNTEDSQHSQHYFHQKIVTPEISCQKQKNIYFDEDEIISNSQFRTPRLTTLEAGRYDSVLNIQTLGRFL